MSKEARNALLNYLKQPEMVQCSYNESERLFNLLQSGGTLPAGYKQSAHDPRFFYSYKAVNLSDDEAMMLTVAKVAQDIRIIKGCQIFFTAMLATSLVAGIGYTLFLFSQI